MASTYFLNAQPGQISINLNEGSAQVLAGLNDPDNNPFCKLDLKPLPDKDVLGTGGVNRLVVITMMGDTEWTITLDMSVIRPNSDIQFLVFANQVLGRQGTLPQGFKIVQTGGRKRKSVKRR
jgi:hypothetical protein